MFAPLAACFHRFWEWWNSVPSVAQNITYNVIGGILTAIAISLYWSGSARLLRRKFRHIFGQTRKSYFLCYGALVLRRELKQLAATNSKDWVNYPLAKRSNPTLAFSAESAASACEIRAASYLSSAIGRDGRLLSEFASDDELASRLDIDVISFGALSNQKTIDLFSNDANDLAEYDHSKGFFVRKKDTTLLCPPQPNYDYGMIIKIHPQQFQKRTWIACAGIGEWGTSGSAWFLANRWKKIEAKVGKKNFACVIRVESQKDESATLVFHMYSR